MSKRVESANGVDIRTVKVSPAGQPTKFAASISGVGFKPVVAHGSTKGIAVGRVARKFAENGGLA